jgi:hypothetical protein
MKEQCSSKHCKQGQAWLCTYVILATQEAEMGRITVQGQPRQKNKRDPLSINKSGMVAQICNPSYMGAISRRIMVPGWPRQKKKTMTPYPKNN